MPAPLPYSYRIYPGNGNTDVFGVPFPFIARQHVKVYINWNADPSASNDALEHEIDYEWVGDTLINTTAAPGIGQTIAVVRETPIDSQVVQWQTGSPPTGFELNTADRQVLYVVQEILDRKSYGPISSFAAFAGRANTAFPDNEEPKIFYVRSDGDNAAVGRNAHTAFRDIEHALEQAALQEEPWTVMLLDGLSTAGELDVPDGCTVMGSNFQRRTIIRPTPGNEVSNVFRCGNGAHLVNLKFSGWQIDDFDNPTKGFAMAFRPGAVILPGGVPYGQNCVVTSALTEVPTPLPMNAKLGNPAQPKGGGCILADGSVISAYSVFPNIMAWGFTPASPNGLGYVARNRGFINAVNAIGVGAHRHFMCLDGGQLVASACSSQFGDYSFWSEGSTQRIVPLKTSSTLFTTQPTAGALIAGLKGTLIDDLVSYLAANAGLVGVDITTAPPPFETLTRKDSGLFLDAIASSLVHGFERPMLNFAEGMFRFNGVCVYPYAYHQAFALSWDRLAFQLNASGVLTSGAQAMVLALVQSLKDTMDNHWFEQGLAAAPGRLQKVGVRLRSLITAIGHQWTAPLSGVEFFRVPPSRVSRQIQRSIVQKNGGKVRFSGQDDQGNAVFVGGLRIDASSGQLGGPPFDSAVRGRIARATIARSY